MDIPPATLRTETDLLCLDIERLEQGLRAKTMAFNEGNQLWESAYRSKARALAEAMLSYVPNGDSRIHVEFATGNLRFLQSDVLRNIERRFQKNRLGSISVRSKGNCATSLITCLPKRTHERDAGTGSKGKHRPRAAVKVTYS